MNNSEIVKSPMGLYESDDLLIRIDQALDDMAEPDIHLAVEIVSKTTTVTERVLLQLYDNQSRQS